jgi:hypothetical protein
MPMTIHWCVSRQRLLRIARRGSTFAVHRACMLHHTDGIDDDRLVTDGEAHKFFADKNRQNTY